VRVAAKGGSDVAMQLQGTRRRSVYSCESDGDVAHAAVRHVQLRGGTEMWHVQLRGGAAMQCMQL